jgi:hypothetical protein
MVKWRGKETEMTDQEKRTFLKTVSRALFLSSPCYREGLSFDGHYWGCKVCFSYIQKTAISIPEVKTIWNDLTAKPA